MKESPAEVKAPGSRPGAEGKQLDREQKRTAKHRRDQPSPPAPYLRKPPEMSGLELLMLRNLYPEYRKEEAPPSLLQYAISAQPMVLRNWRQYREAEDLALLLMTSELRKLLRERAKDAATDGLSYWLRYFGLEKGRGGRQKETFAKTKVSLVGFLIKALLPRFREGLVGSRKQTSEADRRAWLEQRGYPPNEIDAILQSRTAEAAVCRYLAIRENISLKTIQNYWSLCKRNKG